MNQVDYKKKYDEALERMKSWARGEHPECFTEARKAAEFIFPELAESEDERIRKEIIDFLELPHHQFAGKRDHEKWIAWLEKQGTPAKLTEEEQNRFAKGVLTSCAMSFIDYLDAHKYEGKMCVSNGECGDIENAFHNAMWDRLHRYYCKYIEKQGEQKPADKVEPKFREGDWVVSKSGNLWRIDSFDEKHYHVSDIDGEYFIPISKQDEIQLYLSQEAKRGVCDAKQELERKGEQKYKFNIGDIISNGQVVYRVENITKNYIGQDCYFLVNVESEKMGMRYLLMSDSKGNTSHFGETTWLCEQVDKSFEKQGEKS